MVHLLGIGFSCGGRNYLKGKRITPSFLIFFGIAITAAIETGETGHSHGHDHSHSHGETNGFQFKPFNQNSMVSFGFAVGSLIHFWFVAWCVETFAGIRHYARETAIVLTGKAQEEAEDTKPSASQEQ